MQHETRWSDFKCFNVKKCYVCALVGVLIKCSSSISVFSRKTEYPLISGFWDEISTVTTGLL